ncbi:hypothetical protein F2Q70_00002149 [Brassica cretica]|uniref:Aspartic peptidase DDI1-type domain-containing protein n=1 Tax=Brassica cretica TaxID=69181 RepID=A0A8S9J005_BRACR|nr:hypothetical protein F2Q70_00002149 [Brassica cretica]
MFFRETRETEDNIRRMFCEAREKMRKKNILKKKSDLGKFALPCTVKGIEFPHALCDIGVSVSILPRIMADHLGLQVEPSKELFTFVDCSQRNSGGIVRDLEVQIACHCGAEYETEYSASIETHTATSIDCAHQKSTDTSKEESEYDEDYEEEQATEYKNILDEEDKLLHHCSWKKNAPSIDRTSSPSIDTQPHQGNRKRASTDIAYNPSIDTYVYATRDRDYSIGSWTDDRHHESYAVETAYCDQGADELHEGFTYEELLNMQRHDETDLK